MNHSFSVHLLFRLHKSHCLAEILVELQKLQYPSQANDVLLFISLSLLISANADEMVVTWVTLDATNSSIVEYGHRSLDAVAKGIQDVFVDGGSEKRKIYMHRVTLSGLKPSTTYSKFLQCPPVLKLMRNMFIYPIHPQ